MIQMSGISMNRLLSTRPACEYNITCVCCSGKSGIFHMIPIFINNLLRILYSEVRVFLRYFAYNLLQ